MEKLEGDLLLGLKFVKNDTFTGTSCHYIFYF